MERSPSKHDTWVSHSDPAPCSAHAGSGQGSQLISCFKLKRRRGGLIVSALDSGASAPGSSPGLGHCVVFLGKTLYSHGASLHPGV